MVLVDLNGFTHGARSGVTAMRPAPVTVFDQVNAARARCAILLWCHVDSGSSGICWYIWRASYALEQRPHQHERGDGGVRARADHVYAPQFQPPQ
jgi:hypothetical protein